MLRVLGTCAVVVMWSCTGTMAKTGETRDVLASETLGNDAAAPGPNGNADTLPGGVRDSGAEALRPGWAAYCGGLASGSVGLKLAGVVEFNPGPAETAGVPCDINHGAHVTIPLRESILDAYWQYSPPSRAVFERRDVLGKLLARREIPLCEGASQGSCCWPGPTPGANPVDPQTDLLVWLAFDRFVENAGFQVADMPAGWIAIRTDDRVTTFDADLVQRAQIISKGKVATTDSAKVLVLKLDDGGGCILSRYDGTTGAFEVQRSWPDIPALKGAYFNLAVDGLDTSRALALDDSHFAVVGRTGNPKDLVTVLQLDLSTGEVRTMWPLAPSAVSDWGYSGSCQDGTAQVDAIGLGPDGNLWVQSRGFAVSLDRDSGQPVATVFVQPLAPSALGGWVSGQSWLGRVSAPSWRDGALVEPLHVIANESVSALPRMAVRCYNSANH